MKYKHVRIVKPSSLRRKGLTKFRSVVTPRGRVLRLAFPPGRRRRGSGQLQAILYPRNPRPTKIYHDIIEIKASKAGMVHKCDELCRRAGHRYVHEFKPGSAVYGLADGSILIKPRK